MDVSFYVRALEDYKDARRNAAFQGLIALLTGKTAELELLSYEEVRQKLRGVASNREYRKTIPLDSIVGSVGRYHDFTRNFLPRESIDKERWAHVMAKASSFRGLPPIDVYQIGEVYFVLDGNHRVSVARQMGNETIEAYVTKIMIEVPLTPDTTPDDLIIKAEYANFLEETKLSKLRPEADLTATRAGAYPILLEHIDLHRYFMGKEQDSPVPYEEAVGNWYDEVYLPVINIIQGRGILRSFPRRTKTDLYIWLGNHQEGLKKKLGWEVDAETAAVDLASRYASLADRFSKRAMNKFLKIITPETFVDGSPPGEWRKERDKHPIGEERQLFADILVAIDQSQNTWHALDEALVIAKYENSAVHGLHVFPSKEDQESETISKTALVLGAEFTKHHQAAGNEKSELTIAMGKAGKEIIERSRFTDLVILPLNNPPGEKPVERLASGLRNIIQRSRRPLLTVPGAATPLKHMLLAYDGSPKSREALYIAAYMANRWENSLTVLSGSQGVISTKGTLRE
ncbi:MAG: universal stress protein, partial [Chloroflexota bacterium]|nr:universal stress protein [Chloroflexota bacterium]